MTGLRIARIDPMLLGAVVLAVLFHGALLMSGSYRGTYDAWVHIFFGDHYARDWFSTWEPRWYTGFTVTSYPPASHQAIGLTSRAVGLEAAFVAVQLAAIVNVVAGVYRFSLLWVSRRASGWATLLAVVSSSMAEVVHTFGQLPTTFALGFLLHAQPAVRRWVHDGTRTELCGAVVLLAATTAGHHVTTLFGTVFFTGPVVVRALLDRCSPRWRQARPAIGRTVVLAALTVGTVVVVVLPYWLWSSTDPISQVPIPHASRNDFLSDRSAGLVFWLVPWSSMLLIAPVAWARAVLGRAWPLAASVAVLTLLGTGATTPIPRLLLGGAFDVLTLDRFTIWATVAMLPLVGRAAVSVIDGTIAAVLAARIGTWAPRVVASAVAAAAIVSTLFAATLSQHRPFQPRQIDPAPIAAFMDKDQHDRWRYLTLGFGDQMAWVSANTTALTVDGNYHSVRRLPELTNRAVERLEGAKYRGVAGIGSLQQFLGNPSPYHLKFVFSIDQFYDPLLWASGWQRIGRLDNDVEVWERADVAPLPDVLPQHEIPAWQRAMWGVVPLSTVGTALGVALWWISRRRHLRPSTSAPCSPGRPAALTRSTLRRRIVGRVRALATPTTRRVRRVTALSTGATTIAAVGLAFGIALPDTGDTPADSIAGYYTALDRQNFADAYTFLDPTSRPDRDMYLLEASVQDGLLGGYSELDSVASTVSVDGDRAVAQVELVYVTAVHEYRIQRTHELHRRDGGWYLQPALRPPEPAVEQITVRPEVSVSTLGRSSVTTGRTSFDDIVDRPRLSLGPSRTYRSGQRWVVVGTVTNIDVDPADVTVNGVLRDHDARALAAFDANTSSIHQVLPGETVPYRIDFESRAGAFDRHDPAAGDFDPNAFAAPMLRGDVASVEISSRAVVTGGQLERVLNVEAARVVSTGHRDQHALAIELRLRNGGTDPATVARITMTALDARGRAVWVDHHWVPESVRPQRTTEVSWVATFGDLTPVDLPVRTFDNAKIGGVEGTGLGAVVAIEVEGDPPVVGGRTVESVRLDVTSFQRRVAP